MIFFCCVLNCNYILLLNDNQSSGGFVIESTCFYMELSVKKSTIVNNKFLQCCRLVSTRNKCCDG